MATERLSMRRTREILRQRPALGRAHRAIGASVGLGVSTVGSTVRRAAAAKLTWPEIEALSDSDWRRACTRPPIRLQHRSGQCRTGPSFTRSGGGLA